MDETKLQQLNKLLGAMDTNAMSSEEITKGFELIIKHVEDGKKLVAGELEAIKKAYESIFKERKMYEEFKVQLDTLAKSVEDRLATVRDGIDGKDGRDGRDGVDGKDGRDGERGPKGDTGSPDNAIVKKFEKDIDNLSKRIDEMGKVRSGGTSAMGVASTFKWIAHTEAPTGDIDGVNTTYTVKNTIWWVAGFTLNGEQIAQLPNFTVAGRTITFSSPIPAVYSGKDFEVKYIGT